MSIKKEISDCLESRYKVNKEWMNCDILSGEYFTLVGKDKVDFISNAKKGYNIKILDGECELLKPFKNVVRCIETHKWLKWMLKIT